MAAMEASPSRAVSGLAAQRACDECRTRKIRCDRSSPCSHCRAAGLACRTTQQRPKEHKDRVQVTKQYELKIDRIESRLASIEHLLRQSASSAFSSPSSLHTGSPSQPAVATNHIISTSHSHLEDDHNPQTPATGDIGLRAESMAAKVVFEQAIGSDPVIQHDPQIKSALESLRGIVHRAQLDTSGTSKASTDASTMKPTTASPSLDWDTVRGLLKRAERDKPMTFTLLSPSLFSEFCSKARSMFEHGRECSPQDKLLVYSGMVNVCTEFCQTDEGKAAEYNYGLSQCFSQLLLEALNTFPMLAPATMETVEALLAAASSTIDMCKPSLSWSLTCAAARMCQSLGFNRLLNVDPSADPLLQRKIILFWCVYVMDRNTSLRLGRAPAIQDYDVDTPIPTASDEYPNSVIKLLTFWIDCGKLQGKICTQLYGPAASKYSPDERATVAEAFADELETIHRRKTEANPEIMPLFASSCQNIAGIELFLYGDDMMHYSTLTTALYAIPANHPRRYRALEAARQCLRLGRDISKSHLDNVFAWTVYCHWVLLHTPLTPFTGVFCHIIANPINSQADLQLIEDFVASLQPSRRLSEGIEKFHQLCSIFVKVAQAYVRVKSQQQAAQDHAATSPIPSQALQPAIGEFDEHFSALGFFGPPAASNHKPGTTASDGVPASFGTSYGEATDQQQQFFDMTSLQDWYSGNVNLYGLLENDLQDLNDIGFGYFSNT